MKLKTDRIFLVTVLLLVVSCSQENLTTEATCGVTNTTQICYCSPDLMGLQTCAESGMWTVCECVTVADMRDVTLEPDIGQQDIATDSSQNDSVTLEMGEVLETDLALNDSSTQEMGEVFHVDLTPDETSDVESDVSEDVPVVGDLTDAGEVLEDVGQEEDLEPEPVFDCAAVSLVDPPEMTVYLSLRGNHGLAFDAFGNFYGANGNRLYTATYGEPAMPFGGFVGEGSSSMEQIDMLPDGDIVACELSAVYRISTETGGNEVMSTAGGCYGVRVGPDGMVYTGDATNVYQIDPETGDREIYVRGDEFSPRVMDFSPDGSRMYMGSNTGIIVYYVNLNDDMEVISEPQRFRSGVGPSWVDGLGVDICGNVYVTEYNTGGMYRISPDATEMTTLWSVGAGGPLYGHGIQWGSGVGGWDDHTIYVPLPYNGDSIGEAYIGYPYRTWEGTVLNRIPML